MTFLGGARDGTRAPPFTVYYTMLGLESRLEEQSILKLFFLHLFKQSNHEEKRLGMQGGP